jgi:hypothetical protein
MMLAERNKMSVLPNHKWLLKTARKPEAQASLAATAGSASREPVMFIKWSGEEICRWIKDANAPGGKVWVPECYGGIGGKSTCTCSATRTPNRCG